MKPLTPVDKGIIRIPTMARGIDAVAESPLMGLFAFLRLSSPAGPAGNCEGGFMAYRRWGALCTLTAVAVLCFAGTSATNATGLELSLQNYDKHDVSVAYDFVRDLHKVAKYAIDARALPAVVEVVAIPAQAEDVAAKPEHFLFTENGKAIAEWGRLRS